MTLWKTSIIISVLCAIPYALFFGTRHYFSWVILLVLALILAFSLMYYVLLKSPTIPKKTS